MSKIADAEANATSLDSLVNDNALVPTLRNGPKPSYQYLVDGWNTEFDALIDNLEIQGDNAIALINADVVTVDAAKNSAISSIDSDLSAFDVYYQSAKDTISNDVAEFTIDSDAALADFELNASNSLSEFTIDSDAALADFAQESAEAFNEFDLTLDQYKESRGFNTKGTFTDGFTYELPNDVGLDADGNPWILIDTSSLPVIVSAGTTPSNPPYKQVAYGTAAQVSTNTSDTVQSFVDSFALKIFQSPSSEGLTEIQTRTVAAGEVYEVRKTSDGTFATIYSNAAGTTEIVQNGTSNKSGSTGAVEFYIADGDYYVEVDSVQGNFDVKKLEPFKNTDGMEAASYLSKYAEDTRVSWLGRRNPSDGGSNWGLLKFGAHTADGGSIFSIDSNTYVEANLKGRVSTLKFGGKVNDNTFDNAIVINKMLALGLSIRLPVGVSYVKSGIKNNSYDTIVRYYTSTVEDLMPTFQMSGYGTELSVIRCEGDTLDDGSEAILSVNTNPDDILDDAYIFNSALRNFSIRGNGSPSCQIYGLQMRGMWHGELKQIKIQGCYDGIDVDGSNVFREDDFDTNAFIDFRNVSLINNVRNGFSSLKTRPAGLNFYNCELRGNGNCGYEGSGAAVKFFGGSISVNGTESTRGGGIRIKRSESDAVPRGFGFIDTTFEANHEFEIEVESLNSGSFIGVIFTPYENSGTSTTKSIIKVLTTDSTENVSFHMSGCRVNAWAANLGQPISFVRTNSNFGSLNVKETGTVFAGGVTQENMQRYVFNNLDNKGWKVSTSRYAYMTDGADIVDITDGANSFAASSSKIVPLLSVDDDNTFTYNDNGGWSINKDGLYSVFVNLPISGLGVEHSGIVLDIRVNSVQASSISRSLPLNNGQYDVPIALSCSLFLKRNDSVFFNCRIAGSDTTPVDLKRDGNYMFSIESQ
tara:strand:+ start:7799 stop:10573 length:2775 start_codon:yes stop_codon:yes gene_type:complete